MRFAMDEVLRFSEDELTSAYSRIVSEPEARTLAKEMLHDTNPHATEHEAFVLSPDVLDLLSLV
jgi:hypothetical protein